MPPSRVEADRADCSDGDLHSKAARESFAGSLVEAYEAVIQIDGPDELLGAFHQGGQVRGGKGRRLVLLWSLARCGLFTHLCSLENS